MTRAASSPKRRRVEIIGRPEGGSGGTGPAVVPPAGARAKREIAATLHELVETLIALAAVDCAPFEAPEPDLPLLLNAVEAGKLLSISRSKVLDLAGRGHLPSVRVGGSVRIPRDRLMEWIDSRSEGPVEREVARFRVRGSVS